MLLLHWAFLASLIDSSLLIRLKTVRRVPPAPEPQEAHRLPLCLPSVGSPGSSLKSCIFMHWNLTYMKIKIKFKNLQTGYSLFREQTNKTFMCVRICVCVSSVCLLPFTHCRVQPGCVPVTSQTPLSWGLCPDHPLYLQHSLVRSIADLLHVTFSRKASPSNFSILLDWTNMVLWGYHFVIRIWHHTGPFRDYVLVSCWNEKLD